MSDKQINILYDLLLDTNEENTDNEKIEFWYDHGSTMTANVGGNTGPYSNITLD